MFASRKFMCYFLSLPAYYCQRFVSIYTHECIDLLSLFWPQNCDFTVSLNTAVPYSQASLHKASALLLFWRRPPVGFPSLILNASLRLLPQKKWVLVFANTAHVNKTVCRHFKFNSVRVVPLPFWSTWPSIVKICISILPLAYHKTGNSFLQPSCKAEVVGSFCI